MTISPLPPGSRARSKIIPFKGSFCQACEPNIKLLFLKTEIDKILKLKCANSSYLSIAVIKLKTQIDN